MTDTEPTNSIVKLDPGTELMIPEGTAGQYEAYLQEKYRPEVTTASMYREGDTPKSYLDRLSSLYPSHEQQAYLQALFAIFPIAQYGMMALDAYANGKPVHPDIRSMFPPEQNTHIQNQGISDDNKDLWYLTLDPDLPAEAIGACNRAAYLITNYGNKQVDDARKQLINVMTGTRKEDNIPFALRVKLAMLRMQIKAAQKTIGQDLTEQIMKEQIDTLVTYDSMQLFTQSSADSLKEISRSLGEPIRPIELFAMTVTATLALDNLNIHPSVSDALRRVFDASVNQKSS